MKLLLATAALVGAATACTPPSCTACPPRVRKAYSTLSCEERRLYQNAVKKLKQDRPAEYNRFVDTHVTENSFAHSGEKFYPWHRYYILGFENALRSLRGEYSCITIPFWDTESDSTDQWNSRPLRSTLWGRTIDPMSYCLQTGIPKAVSAGGFWTITDGTCLKRGYNPAFSFPGPWDVKLSVEQSFTYSTMLSATTGIHTGPHNYIGLNFKGSASPEEPLFWMHHANVDRIWALWQDYMGHDPTTPPLSSEYSGVLTQVMPFGAANAPGGPLPYYSPTITVQDVMYISNMPNGESYSYENDGVAALMTNSNWRWIVPKPAGTPYIDDCNTLPPYIEYEAFLERLTVFYNGQIKDGATVTAATRATVYYECSLLGNRPRADDEWIAMYGKGKDPIIYESCGAVRYLESIEEPTPPTPPTPPQREPTR